MHDDAMIPTPCGSLLKQLNLPLARGQYLSWDVVDPAALLSWLCSVSAAFDTQIAALHASRPSSHARPWSLVIYVDEATAGALLRLDPSRKSHLWYWQFEEWGPEILSRESNWFLGGVLLSESVHNIEGGLSCVFKYWLKQFFRAGANFADGITCHGRAGTFVIRAVLKTFIFK